MMQRFLHALLVLSVLLLAAGCSDATPLPQPAEEPAQPTATALAAPSADDDLIGVFGYDTRAPLDIQEISESEGEGGVRVQDITFAGAGGERVPAYLVVPPGNGPFAGVLFMHWGGGSRSSFRGEAIILAQAGVVSLLIHTPFRLDSEYFLQTVRNLRRGLDLLESRPDVDPRRLGYVGHSWGATFGGILAGVDRRARAYILMAGLPSFSEAWERSDMRLLDGVRYVDRAAPAVLFFQFAQEDEGVGSEAARQYYEAASEPKSIRWYDTNHRFASEEARQDRSEWLRAELDLR